MRNSPLTLFFLPDAKKRVGIPTQSLIREFNTPSKLMPRKTLYLFIGAWGKILLTARELAQSTMTYKMRDYLHVKNVVN